MARVTDSNLVVKPGLEIPLQEIELRASRSSGPGGQHANKTSTRIEAVFDVGRSQALGASQQARLVKKLGPVVRTHAQDQRSQLRNRELALERLGERIESALQVRRQRVGTKPTSASVQRRLAGKRARADVKAGRRRPPEDA